MSGNWQSPMNSSSKNSLFIAISLFFLVTLIPKAYCHVPLPPKKAEAGRAPTPTAQPKGKLEVRVKDHREAIGDFKQLDLHIESIRVKQKTGLKFWEPGWTDLKSSIPTLDLTQYIGNRSALVLSSDALSGAFEAFELKLARAEGVLKQGLKMIPVKNALGPVAVSFAIAQGATTSILLDLVIMDLSDHPPRSYELHLKGYEIKQDGKLIERIPPG